MDNIKDDKDCGEANEEEQEQMDVGSIFRCIFSSCDVDNTDLVPVSKLIGFVKPYLSEDLNALENLRHSLDPEGNSNALVNSEHFYQVMNLWSQKVAATTSREEDSEFNRSPSRLQVIDDKDLPYTHSTPRASIGEKLLRCKDLLNLSNVSGYSLSTSRLDNTNPADPDKTVLEEEIKKLEHQLSKTSSELTITKQQLTASEEQNDTLQQDLERLNRRLHAEQQVNEHLQKEKVLSEELREELTTCKKVIEELKKKLSQSEKDSIYHRDVIEEQDKEKIKFEKKIEVLSKQHQDCLKEIFDVKTELETKEQQLTDVMKVYDELKLKLIEHKDFNDQLREENDILSHQKSTLEKALKAKSFNLPHSNLGNLNLNLSHTCSPLYNTKDTYYSPESSPFSPSSANQSKIPKRHSHTLLRRALARNSSTPVDLSLSLLDSSFIETVKSDPVLSPVLGLTSTSLEERDQRQYSSEEDLYWKLQQGGDAKIEGHNLNGTVESLHSEMHKANPIVSETYNTVLFEKDEQIMELEEELDKIKSYLKKIEDEKNDCVSKIKNQQKINSQLMETNFILETRISESKESSPSKINTLKTRMAHLQRNEVIVENDQENLQDEIEDTKNQIATLKEVIKSKEIEIKELNSSKIESEVLLKEEVAKLKENLKNAEVINIDLDKRLQETISNGSDKNNQNVDLEEKLSKLYEQSFKVIKEKNQNLEDENFVLRKDLECSKSKYDLLANRFSTIEEELCDYQDRNNNMDHKLKDCEEDKKVMTCKFEEIIREKNEKLKHLQDLQIQTDKDLDLFKQNLEKKFVGEFEGKVKYSMEAEEKILNLTKKCKQLEEDLKGQQETTLRQEIEQLKAANTELELAVENLKSEQDDLLLKLEKINKIGDVASQIQNHITDKNVVIEELKQLNKKVEFNLVEAQLDLKGKVKEILNLRNEWSKNIDIKNDLWNRLKTLQKENNRINVENRALLEKERQQSKSYEELNIEYNNLLILYDQEIGKSTELNQLVKKNDNASQTEAVEPESFDEEFIKIKLESEKLLEELETKLNEEVDKNRNTTQDLMELKKHLDCSNAELFQMREKITDNEAEIDVKLQEKIEHNNKLAEEMIRTKDALRNKDVELNELLNKMKIAEKELKVLKEENVMLNNELTIKCDEIENMKQAIKNNAMETQRNITAKNTDLLKKLTEVESLLNLQQTEMSCVENNNRELLSELNLTKEEKDKMNKELFAANAEILRLKELQNEKDLSLEQKKQEITHIKNTFSQLEDELNITKQEKDTLNNKLQNATSEIINLQQELQKASSEIRQLRERNGLLNETKQKLQEEIAKNKALFDRFSLLKRERDKLSLELNDTNAALTDTKTLYIKRQADIKEILARCSELESKINLQEEQLKKSTKEINNNNLERISTAAELSNIKSALAKANLEIKTLEMSLSETKKELDMKCIENQKLIMDLEEVKRKWSESFNSDGSTGSTTEKETTKRKTYSKQQITIDKLKEKMEDVENQLKLERIKKQDLISELVLLKRKIIDNEECYNKEIIRLKEEVTAKEKILKEMEQEYTNKEEIALSPERKLKDTGNNETTCDARSVNKFTLAARSPASPDSPSTDVEVNGLDASRKLSFHSKCPFTINCDSTIEIPSLDVNGFADDIIEELELTGSPRKKLDREETEKNVTALTLRLLVSSNDISERIEHQTEKYRSQYEEILSIVRDISHRLRDHVCIGTAEPIMPVFVLLEDIKLQLKEVVQTAGQVGVLIYEDRMKKCWNLVTNYMAMLRQENESLLNLSRDSTPTQTGLRRRHKFSQDKADLPEKTLYRRKRISCSRLTAILLFVLGVALTISIIIHLNCRMTASENQYCPLDGIITRINVGIPPM